MALEQWLDGGGVQGRVLILRHDVDQHPASAVRMARIEAHNGVHATWYFRWRTSSPSAIEAIRELGGGVGLHYETLTRFALERGLASEQIEAELVDEARAELRREVSAFQQRFGPIRSIAAHGDTRVPGVSNQTLMTGVEPAEFGVSFDVGEALAGHRLALWMTDRTSAEGRWKDGTDPLAVMRESDGPVLCLTHPNNWCSGASLWSDRLRARVWRRSDHAAMPRRTMRTASDRPASDHLFGVAPRSVSAAPELRSAAPVRPFAPIAVALRREIVRHYYDSSKELVSESALMTLDTNSTLAESRVIVLERALAQARVFSVRDRDLIDLGCGFGALALVFAARGARVTALDPNAPRLEVGARVARDRGLPVDWIVGGMDATDFGQARFDVAVMNNSLCYVVDRDRRRRALDRALAALRPGGVLVIRNPKRIYLRDQFTGLPFLAMLPPEAVRSISRVLGINRSDVRLLSARAACQELREAGFIEVQAVRASERSRPLSGLTGYQHLVARRPAR
jgi:SAM-dependent methyltransferase